MTTTDNKALADRLIDQARWFEHQADVEREPETKASHRECARDCREAAVALSALPQADKARGEVVAWIEPGHLREQGKLAARAGYGMPLIASTAPRDQTCIPLYATPQPQGDASGQVSGDGGALRERLVECRDWFEAQAKVISKGNGSTWDLMQVREQRDLCDTALSTPQARPNHKLFPVNVMGGPMREVAPGKWENAIWPSEQARPDGDASPEVPGGGEVLAPHFRGYAHLGAGGYMLLHSSENEPAELCIVPATDEEKVGRTVGDLRDDGPDEIPAERMAVRLRFENVAGLDALEQQLRLLREVHFPDTRPTPAPDAVAQPDGGAVFVSRADLERVLKNGGPHENMHQSDVDKFDDAKGRLWDALEVPSTHPTPAPNTCPEAAEVCAEAYQVVGCLLDDLGAFNSERGQKILDNLSQHRMVHKDVLPWPSMKSAPDVARLVEATTRLLPTNVCLDNYNVPDREQVPLLATLGELRAMKSALAPFTAAQQEGE